jgi:serine/threonine protein kinase
MTLAAGTKLDSYEVLGLLGAGGMGEVYRARDPVLKREVAIKLLPPFVSQDPERLHRFEQEAQAAAALNHPNILAVHRFAKQSITVFRSPMDYRPHTKKASFIATLSRRTCSSPKTAGSKFWISVSRN